MSDFGDYESDDAYDTEPPDPEQVARKLHQYRQEDEGGLPVWEGLSEAERVMLVTRVAKLIDWLRRQGAVR